MELKDIQPLLDKGFTPDQIMALVNSMTTPAPEPATPAPENDIVKALAAVTTQVTELSKTIQEIQKSNAKAAQISTPAPVSVEDVVKDFFDKPEKG